MIKSKLIGKYKNISHGFFNNLGGYSRGIYKSLNCGIGSKDKKPYIQAGGGIVYDSDPEKEFQETINKANALIAAAEDSYKYS